jgi:hypothetical protein
MSSQIDFRTLPTNIPSLCIPRVFSNIDEKRIRRIFDELNMGEIERIDVVSKTTEKGEKFNRVFVHFKRWLANNNADTARERLINGKEIKIIYDDPWFWKVSAYRESYKAHRHPVSHEKPPHKKPSLQFDSDEDRPSQKDDMRPRPRTEVKKAFVPRTEVKKTFVPRNEVKKTFVPRSPSNSPPRERHIMDEPLKLDYGNCPVPKKRNKKPLKIETEDLSNVPIKEEGEVQEQNV